MQNAEIVIELTPAKLKAYARNELQMTVALRNLSDTATFWGECEVNVVSPLSLAPDTELNTGRMRIGLMNPLESASKVVRLYTRPNNFPDEYSVSVVAYIYDKDGAIAERIEKRSTVLCAVEENVKPVQGK